MTPAPQYIVDANVLIRAKNDYYAFDLAPGFWDLLSTCASLGTVGSIDRVKTEWDRGKDQLTTWLSNRFAGAIESTNDQAVVERFGDIMQWVHD